LEDNILQQIDLYLKTLYPINRSITGKGNEKTLKILQEICPLKIKSISSGTSVFDWTIPPEWNVKKALITDLDGNVIVDFKNLNIHLVNYSTPIDKIMSFDELDKHLFYLKEKPEAIPYRTSYYKRNWGFCLSYNQYKKIDKSKKYHVCINSTLDDDGKMVYGELYKKGKSKKEIIISSYICHPSLANDNLSGLLLSCFLFKTLSQIDTYYSYRLLLVPETIGPIAWLHQNSTKNIKGGLVISCVAGPGPLGYKKTYLGDHKIDKAIKYALNKEEYIEYKFEPIGSDERQYSSPAFRIPIGTITKSKYYEYDEYHTSLDNLEFISSVNLLKSLTIYIDTIFYLEKNQKYKRKFNQCEFMLSKLDKIYPDTGGTISQPSLIKDHTSHTYTPKSNGNILDCIAWLSFGCDGKNSLFDIQEMSGLSIDDLIYSLELLQENKLIL
tara:strand:+ start:677 stop:1999 length:1323 start_codon:yes stop_codon:yes gene_type:complete